MLIIYILLTIIAIGVLLASESGKILLFWILVVLGIAGCGYLAFLLIFGGYALFESSFYDNILGPILGGIMITGIIAYGIYNGYQKIIEIKNDWIKFRTPVIVGSGLLILYIALNLFILFG